MGVYMLFLVIIFYLWLPQIFPVDVKIIPTTNPSGLIPFELVVSTTPLALESFMIIFGLILMSFPLILLFLFLMHLKKYFSFVNLTLFQEIFFISLLIIFYLFPMISPFFDLLSELKYLIFIILLILLPQRSSVSQWFYSFGRKVEFLSQYDENYEAAFPEETPYTIANKLYFTYFLLFSLSMAAAILNFEIIILFTGIYILYSSINANNLKENYLSDLELSSKARKALTSCIHCKNPTEPINITCFKCVDKYKETAFEKKLLKKRKKSKKFTSSREKNL
jgi:hypothetical protein